MKNRNMSFTYSFLGSILLIFLILLIIRNYFNFGVNPPEISDLEKVKTVSVEDIDHIVIGPLLSGWSERKTIKNKILIDKRNTINKLLKLMSCNKTASELAGRWWADRQIKMVYSLTNTETLTFQLSFHMNQNVVDYYILLPKEELVDRPRYYSNCGSRKLYDLLIEIIKKNNVDFVPSAKKNWLIGDEIQYVGGD